MIKKVAAFLLLNFAALAIGGIFTGSGVPSEWYNDLSKAPWTPPGWVFGAAWTIIMICFAFYMACILNDKVKRKTILTLYLIQWILNVTWNPAFFYFHNIALGLVLITSLTLLIIVMMVYFRKDMHWYTLLIFPYFVWLIIATSLNAYILIYN